MTVIHDECDLYCCEYCMADDKPLRDYHNMRLCDDCIEFERTVDLDSYEKKKRERIAEQQEY